MKKLISTSGIKMRLAQLLSVLVFCTLLSSVSFAQTAGGTAIVNQASATYSDGNGNTYSTVSNTVTVTVAKVSGLRITPDAGSISSVVPGQRKAVYPFTVTNTGNFADQVRFLASGASIQLSGSGTLSRAVIDVDGSGTLNTGDTDILTNAADVLSASTAQNASFVVLVEVDINANAAPGSVVNVQLGDTTTNSPTFDNQPANSSAHEVRTVSTTSVNGLREARGDVSATVDTDAKLVLTLNAPAGPYSAATSTTPGSTYAYIWNLCNTGLRPAIAVTLTNAPSGSNTGVFIFAPIPVGTSLTTGQTFPAGTLYTTSPLTVTPLNAVWTTTAPSNLATVTRIGFNNGASLAAGSCIAPINMQVTITTLDATRDIYAIGDVFATNYINTTITDQSGDTVANGGDGNADFEEDNQPGNVGPEFDGIQQITLLTRLGSILIGPNGSPAAVGPTSNNDDYTNRSTSVPGVPAGGTTPAASSLVYTNTLQNTGNANDSFTLSLQSAPAGFTVEISLDGGATYTTVTTNTLNLAINYGQTANIMVRVTAPAGTNVLQTNGFNVVIRSTSVRTPTAYNETIDRFYTGILRMDKTAVVTNGTGVGGVTDAVPGAVIEYTITYRNLASTGGTGNQTLTISNLVITENGAVAPNNWASSTDQVVGSSSDNQSGTIVGDAANSTLLTDTVPTLAPQITGLFKFKRVIR